MLKIDEPYQVSPLGAIPSILYPYSFREHSVKCFVVCNEFLRAKTLNLLDSIVLRIDRNAPIDSTHGACQSIQQKNLLKRFPLRPIPIRRNIGTGTVLVAVSLKEFDGKFFDIRLSDSGSHFTFFCLIYETYLVLRLTKCIP
ncbi:MAG: hypothetical protein BWX92_03526 [Deltaproteobacteria bacterium ADurb.Bin135]|nr:MAG: hypothetical protein BWX92_03526 [Deltaproteobacteria bacterium ADurb.Bin135]